MKKAPYPQRLTNAGYEAIDHGGRQPPRRDAAQDAPESQERVNGMLSYRRDGEKGRFTMKGLTLVLTSDDIAATLAPLYAQYNRDSRNDYETRRDYPETLYNAEKCIDANVCTARMRDYGNRIRGVERMLMKQCGVEFSHNDRFHPCHAFEKVYMNVGGEAYTVFDEQTDSK